MTRKAIRLLMVFLGLALIHSAWTQATRAQDNYRAKATKVTLTEQMQLPGTVLPPGEYVFRLNDSDANRHIVEIWDKGETKRITQVLAIPNQRLRLGPNDKGIMSYAERPAGQPVALEAWFYSGEENGQQFVYPKTKAAELSRLNRTEVPSTGTEEAFPGEKPSDTNVAAAPAPRPADTRVSEPAPARAPEPAPVAARAPEPVYSASAQTPAPRQDTAPARSNADAQSDANATASNRLPNTASLLPLIGMLGSLLIGVSLLLKIVART